jgi:TonB family protein
MTVLPQASASKLPPDFEALFVEEFKARFKPPGKLDLSVMVGSAPCDWAQKVCGGGSPILTAVAYATALSNGKLTALRIVDASLAREFADSVRSTLLVMSKENMIPFFVSADSIPIEIWLESEPNPDSIPRARQLFRATMPRYAAQFHAIDLPAFSPQPKYPAKAIIAGVGDTLQVNFTVMADGRVARQSVDVTRGHYWDFAREAIYALGKTVFRPARIGRCPVATWVTQKFIFDLQGQGLILVR